MTKPKRKRHFQIFTAILTAMRGTARRVNIANVRTLLK